MFARSMLRFIVFLCATISGVAFGAPCVGFTDVSDTDTFCTYIAWMKSRGVTLGCTATTYCPKNVVTRDQMAAFMYRAANVLSGPTWVDASGMTVGPYIYAGVAHWRSPVGPTILYLTEDLVSGTATISKSGEQIYFATADCSGPGYWKGSSTSLMLPVGFYWRGNEWRLLKARAGVAPAPIPTSYVGGNNVTLLNAASGPNPNNPCTPGMVNMSELFVPVDDSGDVTSLITEPLHIE